jgi:hypothetical protein
MGTTPGWVRGFVPTAQQWSDSFAGKQDDLGYSYAQPVSGNTLTTGTGVGGWILEPAGEIATLTVTAPAGTFDGQLFVISTTRTIDTFQANPSGGQSMNGGGPFVLAENSAVTWKFRLANSTWYVWN